MVMRLVIILLQMTPVLKITLYISEPTKMQQRIFILEQIIALETIHGMDIGIGND